MLRIGRLAYTHKRPFTLVFMAWIVICTYELLRQTVNSPLYQNIDQEFIDGHIGVRKISQENVATDGPETELRPNEQEQKQLQPEEESEEGDFDRISDYLKKNSHDCKGISRPRKVKNLIYGKWHLHNTDLHQIYIYSAFFDERQDNGFYPSIRILAVAKTIKNDTFCQVWLPGIANPIVKKMKVKKNGGGHYLNKTRYEQYYFVCHLDTSYPIPRHVSVVSSPCDTAKNLVPIYIPIRAPYEHEFGVCVPVAFWYVDPYRLVEWIEANRILGVTEINVYHVNMSAETLDILRYYEQNDTIMVLHELPSVPRYEKTRSGNKIGSPISLNDCLYRNTYRYKWAIVIDFDELIVPKKQLSYSGMVNQIIDKYKLANLPPPGMTFRNTYFWTGCGYDRKTPTYSYMLRYLKREKPSKFLYASKSIIDPRRCISVFNHYCYHRFPMREKKEKWTVDVNESIALSHHYRESYRDKNKKNKCKAFKKSAIKDESVLRFSKKLKQQVQKKLHALGLSKKKNAKRKTL